MFKKGDPVTVKHQREMGPCTVVNPMDPTDMTRIGGEPVGYYVRIDTPKAKNQGYHADNLEIYVPPVVHVPLLKRIWNWLWS